MKQAINKILFHMSVSEPVFQVIDGSGYYKGKELVLRPINQIVKHTINFGDVADPLEVLVVNNFAEIFNYQNRRYEVDAYRVHSRVSEQLNTDMREFLLYNLSNKTPESTKIYKFYAKTAFYGINTSLDESLLQLWKYLKTNDGWSQEKDSPAVKNALSIMELLKSRIEGKNATSNR